MTEGDISQPRVVVLCIGFTILVFLLGHQTHSLHLPRLREPSPLPKSAEPPTRATSLSCVSVRNVSILAEDAELSFADVSRSVFPGVSSWLSHAPTFERHLSPLRKRASNILKIELSCSKSTSPRQSIALWRRYLPCARLHVLEEEAQCAEPVRSDVEELYVGGPSNPLVLDAALAGSASAFDAVIDDGSDLTTRQLATFAHIFSQLSRGAVYFVTNLQCDSRVCAALPSALFIATLQALLGAREGPYRPLIFSDSAATGAWSANAQALAPLVESIDCSPAVCALVRGSAPLASGVLLRAPSATVLTAQAPATIVVARWREDTAWVDEFFGDWPHVVVTPGLQSHTFTTPVNRGNEAAAFISYIVANYDNLPANMAFVHGHRDAIHTFGVDIVPVLKAVRWGEHPYVPLNMWCEHTVAAPTLDYQNIVSVWMQLLTDLAPTVPEAFRCWCCAQFAVTREAVHTRSRAFYERLFAWLLSEVMPTASSSRVLEHTWHMVFGLPADSSHIMTRCEGLDCDEWDRWTALIRAEEPGRPYSGPGCFTETGSAPVALATATPRSSPNVRKKAT
jgi:hypothetical protein